MSLIAYLLHLKQLIGSLSVLSDIVHFFFIFLNLASKYFLRQREDRETCKCVFLTEQLMQNLEL